MRDKALTMPWKKQSSDAAAFRAPPAAEPILEAQTRTTRGDHTPLCRHDSYERIPSYRTIEHTTKDFCNDSF